MRPDSRAPDVVCVTGFTALGVAIPVVIVMRHITAADPFHSLGPVWGGTFAGAVIAALAAVVCLGNFYLHVVARRRAGGSMSGLPIIGGFLLVSAGLLLPPSTLAGVVLLALYSIDAVGIPWIVFHLLQDG